MFEYVERNLLEVLEEKPKGLDVSEEGLFEKKGFLDEGLLYVVYI